MRIYLILLLVGIYNCCAGQSQKDSSLINHAMADFKLFVTALQEDSAELLIQYILPSDTVKANGLKGIKEYMKVQKMFKEEAGMRLSNFIFYPPTSIIHYNKTVQCAMSYVMDVDIVTASMHQEQERVVIGISFNEGLKWYFIEVSEGGQSILPDLRKLYPILSPKLIIPKARE